MALPTLDNTNVSKHLGQKSEYIAQYDPSLLVREPRAGNREPLGIRADALPFVGVDVWNVYEVSGLMNNGVPVAALAKFVYSPTNDYIVESKSAKLYFGSFNMTKLGDTDSDVFLEIQRRAITDLSALLETEVQVRVYSSQSVILEDEQCHPAMEYHHNYHTLESVVDTTALQINDYTENPDLLQVFTGDGSTKSYHSALLRSRCRHTGQQDLADVYIQFRGAQEVTRESLLKYIISFRQECHFHEEICEALYKRLYDLGIFSDLHVICLYTRRGGIDLCIERASSADLLHGTLGDVSFSHIKTPRQ